MIRLFARAAPAPRNEQDEQGSTQPPLESDAESAVTDDRSPITPAPVFSLATAAFVSAAAALTFAGLTIWIVRRGSSVPQVDHYLHHWAISQRSPGSMTAARAVTWGGATTVVLPALIVVGAVTARAGRDLTRRVTSGLVLVGIAGAGVYTETRINALVGRLRPPLADWAGVAGGPSFPSGHTSAATLFAALSAWALAARVRPGWRRRAVWAGAAIYATAVAWSRIWLGVHWPTDVIGSWLYGLAWFAGSIALIVTLQRRRAGHRAPWSGGARPGGKSPPRRCVRSLAGRSRISEARTARSSQSGLGPRTGTAQHRHLTPQHQQLNVLGNWRAAKQGKPAAVRGGGRLSGTPQVYGVLHGLVLSVRRGNGI